MPVRALIASAAIFELAENNVRVALSRLATTGMVEQTERGEYHLGPRAAHMQSRVASWRQLAEQLIPWDGSWIGVHMFTQARSRGTSGHRQAKALRLNGFEQFAPGLFLRPNNLAGGIVASRSALTDSGLASGSPVFRVDALDHSATDKAQRLWNSAAIRRGYRDTIVALQRSRPRLATEPLQAAMIESFRLGGAVIRSLVLDPLLPDTMVPAAERRAVIREMERYDRAGRRLWSRHLKPFHIGGQQTPVDTSRIYDPPARDGANR